MFKKIKDFIFKSFNITGLPIIFGILGSLGGQISKEIRRFGIPCVTTIYAYYIIHQIWLDDLWLITILSQIGVLSIGYGIPEKVTKDYMSKPDFYVPDEGSFLGRFFDKLFKGNELWTNIFTRGTIGLLMCLTMLSIPILKGSWLSYLVGCVIIVASYSGLSWQGFGEITVKIGKNTIKMLKVDLIHYSIVGYGIIFIIHGFLR